MFFGRDDKKDAQKRGLTVPLLPLRDIIVFPHMVVPLFVGREKSIAALKDAMAHKGPDDKAVILLAAQKKAKTNDPTPDDIFHFGTVGHVIQLLPLPDGTVKVLVEGVRRAKVRKFLTNDAFFMVEVEEVEEHTEKTVELEALVRSVHSVFEAFVKLNKRIPPEMLMQVASIDDPARLADTIVAHLSLKLNDKQALLETESPAKRLEKLYELMQGEIEILQVEKKIRTRVKKQMEKTQKEYYLNEQMQAIQKELGERDEFKNEIQEIEEKLKNKRMSKEATLKVKKELKKLRMMSPMSAEATVVRNYIDWIISLPWYDETQDRLDVTEAEQVLNEDHYGLKKPKERILEYLAVQQLVKKLKGPVLCFVGPPGVGKTSLARSIARATGRKFVRLSLGGVRDEAEIRGHRRTYIGAMPGKLIQSLKKAGSNNPVFLLDEIDKMSTDFRGDPSAALLEVLDPEQNHNFNDHYLDLDYDLSKVMFICTANTMHNIPGPLQDRMEVIRIAGYTEPEKLSIARRYLIPKEQEANGLADVKIDISNEALKTIIHRYTRESGVRSLEREIGGVFRKIARDVLKKGKRDIDVDRKLAMKFLGTPRFRYGVAESEDQVGIVTGLAWTEMGGEILTTEATIMPGKGKLIITGKLGEVMQESAQAAMSYVRSRAERFGIDRKVFENYDIHVHLPEGAIPKDGPSAGVTICTALVSALTRVTVRKDVAMTGEITLRGRVLPIGGLKEKTLAAHRAGIKTVLIPKANKKDLKDIPKKIRMALRIVPVEFVDDVLREALVLEKPEEFGRNGKSLGDNLKPTSQVVDAQPGSSSAPV
ncbi:endopeptidase La [Stigmatella hybrida]|uniref:endopeptidase La n=1 Tax=Stigmatella hybrida TaxID=394097 RepID=UPI001CDA8A30|nr:endopeptidase La [Stigmatella hybrida]